MAGEKNKATHQDGTDFEGPVNTGDPHAKRPRDKKQGDMNADTSVSSKDPGKVFDSGKVAEQITALFADVPNLSEGFSTKATVIIEGALSERIESIRSELKEEFDSKLETALAEAVDEYADKIDSYLSYVVEQFMEENKVAIDQGIKNEISEQVISSVTQIIEANGVTIPEDKVDVAAALAEEVQQVEAKLNEQIETNVELSKKVRAFEIKEAFAEMTVGLSDAAKDKLVKLTENISFTDVEDYKGRVAILKETFVAEKAPVNEITEQLTQPVNLEEKATSKKELSDRMKAYLAASAQI